MVAAGKSLTEIDQEISVCQALCRRCHLIVDGRMDKLPQIAGARKSRMKTHCPQGHPYDNENTYISPKGDRRCRTCNREKHRKDGRTST